MLSPEQRKRVADEARRLGVPEAAAITAAEKLSGTEEADTGPMLAAERFLIGYLPYVTVREFRESVLGFGPVTDDHLFTGEWLEIHGQKPVTPTATGGPRTSDDDSEGRTEAETPSQ